MKRILTAICVGFTAMTAQLLLARELMAVALGDELTVGLVFFAWMLWVGAGSALGGLIFRRRIPSDATVGLITILLGILVPVSVIWARVQAPLFGFTQGEIIPVDTVLLMALLALLPVCVTAGVAFPLLCAGAGEDAPAGAAGHVYAWDTLGGVAGGLAFSLLIIPFVGSLPCALLAAAAAVMAGSAWLSRLVRSAIMLLLVFCALVNVTSGSGKANGDDLVARMENYSRAAYWGKSFFRGYESPYGTVTVLKEDGQYSLFSSGRFAGAIPDRVFGEFTAHIPLLAHPDPENIFVAGGSPTAVTEILKHKRVRVTVAELDPQVLELKKLYAPEGTAYYHDLGRSMRNENINPRLNLVAEDPRRFLKNSLAQYDVIIIDAGPPENIRVNRYYTVEFFRLLKTRLRPGGIAAVTVPFSENYTGRADAALLGSILKTIEAAGSGRPLPVPGPKTFLLWRPGSNLEVSTSDASARFTAREIRSEHFSAESAAYYFDSARTGFALSQFSNDILEFTMTPDKIAAAFDWLKSQDGASENMDLTPVAVYLRSRTRSSYYPSYMEKILDSFRGFNRIGRYTIWFFAPALALMLLCSNTGAGCRITIAVSIALLGFAGIILEILLLALFQAQFGVVYQYIGLVTAFFLGGCAAGGALCAYLVKKAYGAAMVVMAGAICFALLCIPLFFESVFGAGYMAFESYVIFAILLSSFSAGLAVGCSFPVAVFLFGDSAGNEAGAAGLLYAMDIFGSCAGALLVSAVLFPAGGFWNVLWFTLFTGLCACFGLLSPVFFKRKAQGG